ncbi:Sigma factor AlgU negative regulatory protein [BD1-7 clade bacterium]|uniref:Sigma factor AlgU negative regulatory protein n=1 Tax=BD1-7 clade bacterium TaxID=2029982 RepID=A0A5S9PA04_9GAMM|nr:Sigma factor AlgU negative regulatory protein [BD1-7 clade bacterium]CAA0116004.1 Sigma factor AlgU negative regulatory protein [BD1-7 clade bacterium]
MNDQQKEALSALFDDESSDFETRRLLGELEHTEREQFGRYQLMRDAMQGHLENTTDIALNINVAAAVSAAIADEPVPLAEEQPKKVAGPAWLKPVAGFAAAASVAFVAVLGIQNPDVVNQGFIADGNVSASRMPISGDLGLSQVSGTSTIPLDQAIDNIDLQKQADQQRLNYYLQQHSQHAAFNTGYGLMPMARMQKEEY